MVYTFEWSCDCAIGQCSTCIYILFHFPLWCPTSLRFPIEIFHVLLLLQPFSPCRSFIYLISRFISLSLLNSALRFLHFEYTKLALPWMQGNAWSCTGLRTSGMCTLCSCIMGQLLVPPKTTICSLTCAWNRKMTIWGHILWRFIHMLLICRKLEGILVLLGEAPSWLRFQREQNTLLRKNQGTVRECRTLVVYRRKWTSVSLRHVFRWPQILPSIWIDLLLLTIDRPREERFKFLTTYYRLAFAYCRLHDWPILHLGNQLDLSTSPASFCGNIYLCYQF